MKRAAFALVVLGCSMLLVMTSVGCGAAAEAVKVEPGASPVQLSEGSINGTSMQVMLATTTLARIRAEKAVDLRPGSHNAIVQVFGGDEHELILQPNLAWPADMVFADRKGSIVKTFMGDTNGYVPFAVQGTGGNSDVAANVYRSGAPASVVLFVPRGRGDELKLAVGGKLSLTPDPFAQADKADPDGVVFAFLPEKAPDAEDDPVPPVYLRARVAATAADRARNILAGEEALLLLYPSSAKNVFSEGYWLKGIEGKYSLAFLSIASQRSSIHSPYSGQIVDIIEGAEDNGGDDLERRIWWPSKSSIRVDAGERPSNFSVNAVLVMRGDKAFSSRKIAERMYVTSSAALVHQSTSSSDGAEEDSLVNLSAQAGERTFGLEVFCGQRAIDGAVSSTIEMRPSQARVLVWDSPSLAMVEARGVRKASLRLLAHEGGNQFRVSSIVTVEGGKGPSRIDGAVSRFALMCDDSVGVGAKVLLPWQVANLRPALVIGAFFGGDKPEKHPCTWPTTSMARVHLEIADTPAAIQRGLMFVKSLPKDQGLLFVFDDVVLHEFWMKNCEMDIDVAFIDEDFRVVALHEMKREPEGTPDAKLKLYSSAPHRVKYAVEMEGGWFKKNGVARNDRFWIPIPHTTSRGLDK